MKVIRPEDLCYLAMAQEEIESLAKAIKNNQAAISELITSVLSSKLSKKDSQNFQEKLRAINPAYWQVEGELKNLRKTLIRLQEESTPL